MQSVPQWITKDYFLDILAKEVPNFENIHKFTPTSGCEFGEGATSDLVRVQFEVQLKDGTSKPFSLMMKSKKQLSMDSDKIVAVAGNFTKENEVYDKLLPAFEKLYSDKGKQKTFSPKSFKLCKESPVETVVLEDLKPQHFEMKSSSKGLDLKNMKQTLEMLAEFHAASAVYVEKHGLFGEQFEKGVYEPAHKIYYVTMYQHVVDIIIGSYKKSVRNGEYFADKMVSLIWSALEGCKVRLVFYWHNLGFLIKNILTFIKNDGNLIWDACNHRWCPKLKEMNTWPELQLQLSIQRAQYCLYLKIGGNLVLDVGSGGQ